MLHPPATPPSVTLTPPTRFNPFSQREDLKGGKIKLFDTPSKSVISLTFTLPPLSDPCDDPEALEADGGAPLRGHRRCHSLPCTPPPHITSAPTTALSEEKESPSQTETVNGEMNGVCDKEAGEEASLVSGAEVEERKSVDIPGDDSGLPLDLELMSLDRLDQYNEEVEPMDCTSSPDTVDGTSSPYSKPSPPHSQSSTSSQASTPPSFSNGWGDPISNGPPCLPPLSHLDNNNVVIGRPLGWGTTNGYHSPPGDPAGPSPFSSSSGHSLEQEEVISCPGCCLAGLRFPSMCLRAAPPRRNPYKNLNGDHAATRGLLCPGPNGLPPSPTPTTTSVSPEPGLPLPGAQT